MAAEESNKSEMLVNCRMLRKGGASIWSGSGDYPAGQIPFSGELDESGYFRGGGCGNRSPMQRLLLPPGAIAVDDEQGLRAKDVGYGFVTGHETRRAAERAAMKECRRQGNRHCTIAVWFSRDRRQSLAVLGHGPLGEVAAVGATNWRCSDGKVYVCPGGASQQLSPT